MGVLGCVGCEFVDGAVTSGFCEDEVADADDALAWGLLGEGAYDGVFGLRGDCFDDAGGETGSDYFGYVECGAFLFEDADAVLLNLRCPWFGDGEGV
ncbi:hypothetical protein Ptr902_09777 [Pyrenophora tritici-repentis]|uniref:Uncharacterized protein n=1 Tax=Pyrenophora tritici-repentis TaxID=45151 RepID=A0A2W1EK55_9PLEO|nr:hypothetical protein PtrM4_044440 [Pyrenophora tritici-repentis]KAI1584096.1 hypothetical protein PtrEW7m1_002914 [Pyrenophora tritici-repentis]KAI2478811.1 hypothetical protein Ptr902_09777 [Pyrenophora tritici-repentis]PWO29189.1 pheromone receptor PREB [Pyrenophora tritici-repentis]